MPKRIVAGSAALILAIAALWIVPAKQRLIQGRPLAQWVGEVEWEAMGQHRKANDLLYAAGPQIVPDLTALASQTDRAWLDRLPARFVPDRLKRSASERRRIRANAIYVISVIAFQNPDAREVEDAVPTLVRALDSIDPLVRTYSAQALAAAGPRARTAVPDLVRHAADPDHSVRLCSVEALGRIGVPSLSAKRALREALSDTNLGVRFVATQAISRLAPLPK